MAGEKIHDAPAGNPEQERATGELKPESDVTLIPKRAALPRLMDCDVGVAEMLKFDATVTVTALDVLAV